MYFLSTVRHSKWLYHAECCIHTYGSPTIYVLQQTIKVSHFSEDMKRRNEYVRKKYTPALSKAVIEAALTFAVAVLMAASDCFLKNKKEQEK